MGSFGLLRRSFDEGAGGVSMKMVMRLGSGLGVEMIEDWEDECDD